jgi:hypothetical protein
MWSGFCYTSSCIGCNYRRSIRAALSLVECGFDPQTRIRKPTSPDQYCKFDGQKLLAVNKLAVNKFGLNQLRLNQLG